MKRKLQQMPDGSLFLILPKQYMALKGWEKGDGITVSVDQRGRLVLDK
jgi:hypothetical protein